MTQEVKSSKTPELSLRKKYTNFTVEDIKSQLHIFLMFEVYKGIKKKDSLVNMKLTIY